MKEEAFHKIPDDQIKDHNYVFEKNVDIYFGYKGQNKQGFLSKYRCLKCGLICHIYPQHNYIYYSIINGKTLSCDEIIIKNIIE